jgi:hypothetical protein
MNFGHGFFSGGDHAKCVVHHPDRALSVYSIESVIFLYIA